MDVKTPSDFFEKVLPSKFDPNKVAGFEAVIQMSISGPSGGDWVVTVKDCKLDVKQGQHPSPSITIMMTDTDYVDMINGKLSGERAFMTGKLKLKGSIAVALKLRDIGFM